MVYIDDIRYPNEVVVEASTDDATPATDNDDDFFSSWDKPSIKRPTPPPSRTATPPVLGRTPSPFNPSNSSNGNGIARTKSPLVNSTPAAPRTTSSAVLRTKGGTAATRKGGVLGAKKGAKLGVKKIGASEAIDFDEAEKKAKEEAERIAKLGYDPDAEAEKKDSAKSSVVSPAPISAASPKGHQRNSSDAERLGLQMNRLGFGQVAGAQAAKAAPKKMGGFGSTGSSSAADEDDESFARSKFGTQKGISSDEFFGRDNFDSAAQAEARSRLQGFDGATSISSNQYFGREDEEEPVDLSNYNSLEVTAREFARKFAGTAGDDIENITAALGEGASKLQDAMRQYMR